MGLNVLQAVGATKTLAFGSHVDQYLTALDGDLVPRSGGNPTNLAGNLGQVGKRWGNLYNTNIDASGYSNISNQVRGWKSAKNNTHNTNGHNEIHWENVNPRTYDPYNMVTISDPNIIKFPYTGGYLIIANIVEEGDLVSGTSFQGRIDAAIIKAGDYTSAGRYAVNRSVDGYNTDSRCLLQISYMGQFQANDEIEIVASLNGNVNYTIAGYDIGTGEYKSWLSVAKIW